MLAITPSSKVICLAVAHSSKASCTPSIGQGRIKTVFFSPNGEAIGACGIGTSVPEYFYHQQSNNGKKVFKQVPLTRDSPEYVPKPTIEYTRQPVLLSTIILNASQSSFSKPESTCRIWNSSKRRIIPGQCSGNILFTSDKKNYISKNLFGKKTKIHTC